VAERDARPDSPFREVAELGSGPRKVKGVGPRTLATITPSLCVGAGVDPVVGEADAADIDLTTMTDEDDAALDRFVAAYAEGVDPPLENFPFPYDGYGV
jgi:hypothetical protein